VSLYEELKRRNVVRVGVAYCVIGWILAQVAEFAFETFGAPEWVLKSFVVLLLLGLPLALFVAWAFEITPEGVKREKDVDRSKSITRNTGRKLDRVIIVALVLALVYFVWERQSGLRPADTAEPPPVAAASAEEHAPRSIAVLPFVNMSSDPEQEWFSDGLTEEILNALARTPDLLVAARTSSFKFKNSSDDIPTIARSLGVAHVLEGSVRRGADRLRVTAQLIRASDGFHLWSQTYDRDPEDVIAIQEDVAVEIATALETAMDPEALARMVSSGTQSVDAFNAYVEGLGYGATTFSTGDPYEFVSAQASFERAVKLDPDFALAWWELAKFWNVQLSTNNIVSDMVELPRDEMLARFDAAVQAAIEKEQDPVNVLQYRTLREIQYLNYSRAMALNREYLEKRPNDTRAQREQLHFYADLGLDDELYDAINRYQEANRRDMGLASDAITYSLISNDPAFIRRIATEALERMGDSPFIAYQAQRALLWTGDIDGASRLLREIRTSDLPDNSRHLVELRQACAENRVADAERVFAALMAENGHDYSMNYIGNMIMGRDEAAVDALRELDETKNLPSLADFLSYAYFDATPFPNLTALLERQGYTPRKPIEIPYRCKT